VGKAMVDALRKVIKRMHYPLDVMLTCVRWYVAYPLSLRQLEEMMRERGVFVDHATVHRWTLKVLPVATANCVRSNISTISSSKIIGLSSDSFGQCWDSTFSAARASF
jgi:transposase-like protein